MPDVSEILGKVSLTPKGAYSPTETYERLDAVQYEGSGYVALWDNLIGITPTDGADWMLLASKGATGKTGPQGKRGPQGEQGNGFKVLGHYESEEALRGAVTAPETGDAYSVGAEEPYDFYIYGETEDGLNWKNYGPLQGPAGKDGVNGKDATINGENVLEIVEGDGIKIEQSGETMKISATGGGRLPEGGETGQVLTKTGDSASWKDVPKELPDGGTPGQVLTRIQGGTAWATPSGGGISSGLNRLKNWYFVDPINQRGVNGVISAQGYFIDCWILVSGTVELTSSGLVLDGEIQQKLENSVGEDTVATVLTTTGLMEAEYDDTLKIFSISANGETLIAAKLGPGDKQTLAHQDESGNWVLNDPPPDKALELLKCQRYQISIRGIYPCLIYNPGNSISFFVPLPVQLVKNPAQITISNCSIYSYSDVAGPQTFTSSGIVTVANGVIVNGTISQSFPSLYKGVQFEIWEEVMLDAN